MFIVALCVPRCRYLEATGGVRPLLYADNLKCVCSDPEVLLVLLGSLLAMSDWMVSSQLAVWCLDEHVSSG